MSVNDRPRAIGAYCKMVPEPTRPTRISSLIKPTNDGEGCDGDSTAPRIRIEEERREQIKRDLEVPE